MLPQFSVRTIVKEIDKSKAMSTLMCFRWKIRDPFWPSVQTEMPFLVNENISF